MVYGIQLVTVTVHMYMLIDSEYETHTRLMHRTT